MFALLNSIVLIVAVAELMLASCVGVFAKTAKTSDPICKDKKTGMSLLDFRR